MICLHSATPESTAAYAAGLAVHCPDAAIVHLRGDLGAGKSVFARAFLQAMGITGAIKSPTYTLLETYPLPDGRDAVHMDLYRIADPDELDYLALDGVLERLGVMLVEWPQNGVGRLPEPDLIITFAIDGIGRSLDMLAVNERGKHWLHAAGMQPACT